MARDPLMLRDNNGIVIDKEVRRTFPAVFQHKPHKRTSSKFQLHRSDEIIERFTERGLKLVELGQQRSSKRSPLHTFHLMRFQAADAPVGFALSDCVPELVVANAHDGKSSLKAMLGVFRFICENGMIAADSLLASTVRRHYGQDNTFDKVAAILDEMPTMITAVSNRILDWSGMVLTDAERLQLAEQFLEARAAPGWLRKVPELALQVHRPEDEPKTLWHTFNVLQENLTTRYIDRPSGLTEGRQSPLRPLGGAAASVGYNQRIWSEAQAYYDAKVEGLTPDELAEFKRQRDIWRLRARRLSQKRLATAEA